MANLGAASRMTLRACSTASTTAGILSFNIFHECLGPRPNLVIIHNHPSVAELCVSYAKQFNLLWIACLSREALARMDVRALPLCRRSRPSHVQVPHHMIAAELPPGNRFGHIFRPC